MPRPSLLQDMKQHFQLHPISAHFSNGVIPVAVLYMLLAILAADTFFEHTVKHLLIIVLLAIPVSFASGVYDWKSKFNGAKGPVFIKKIRLSVVLLVLCSTAVAIRFSTPDVAAEGGPLYWLYLASLFGMLPVVTLLGHYGGKLAVAAHKTAK